VFERRQILPEAEQRSSEGIVPAVKKFRAIQPSVYAYASSRWQKRWTKRRPSSSSRPASRARSSS
jgi:hypothetical protein